jgi:hypothetical protein
MSAIAKCMYASSVISRIVPCFRSFLFTVTDIVVCIHHLEWLRTIFYVIIVLQAVIEDVHVTSALSWQLHVLCLLSSLCIEYGEVSISCAPTSKTSISSNKAHSFGQIAEMGTIFFYPSMNCFRFYLLIHHSIKLNAACVSYVSVTLLSAFT